ncbi:hypothetical protein K469DRAFT_181613 [Zopfia rhizophila CBS 207.26]|uniref:Zn(2)-C6 fungal-type domain-containing protein n=1 Tax=Zopfia rhizophila CBS 207.26 TaxID=1314779 RepID=A0A6A6DXD8_9PEZI|nr:hypothetical protein K469DRAFT_181613 [Zopfia rhizophila CBS 207.26]
MGRGGAGKDEDLHSSGSPGQNEPKTSKRRCVQSACVPCRKRKSKCDGGTPMCATCMAVYKTECFYDAESESRRNKTTAQKRDNTAVAERGENAEFIINSIRNLPESEVHELIQHIRKDSHLDLAALAESWRKVVTFPSNPVSGQSSLEEDLSVLLGKPAMTQTGVSRHFGHTSSLGLVAEDENYTRSRATPLKGPQQDTWTTVTSDLNFIKRLFELYFKWSHSFHVIFSRECFYKDFQYGRQKYCSPLLVNAICAYACHFSDEPMARTIPDDPRTAGDHFFAEARRLLFEDETPSLTTTQALCVMALREPSAGRDSSGFMYMGRCMRMAVELGLHLNYSSPPDLGLTPSEIEVRKVTFWGCFVVDTTWSVCIGRISQLPRAAITLDKPILDEPAPDNTHQTFHKTPRNIPGTITTRMFLQEFSTLSELVNDNVYMFFAPRERFTSARLLDCYSKYLKWYRALPLPLRVLDNPDAPAPPHIMTLHMYYHTIQVHLFRPLLKVEPIRGELSPKDMCVENANRVADLLRNYREHYDLRCGPLILTHILLSVCIVHLLFSRSHQTSAGNLVEGLQALEDLSICHYFGGRSFKIIYTLSQTWGLPFPETILKNTKLIPRQNTPVTSPPVGNALAVPMSPYTAEQPPNGYSTAPAGNTVRRESSSIFASDQASPSLPSSSSAPLGNSLIVTHTSSSVMSPAMSSVSTAAPASGSETTDGMFWSPMHWMGVPHQPNETNAMALHNMLGHVDGYDFTRDGFRLSDGWAQKHLGLNGNGATSSMAASGPTYDTWWGNGADGHGG